MGRSLYRVRHNDSGVVRSIVCQIDTVEGSKTITVHSPIQVIYISKIIIHWSVSLLLCFFEGCYCTCAEDVSMISISFTEDDDITGRFL